MRHRVLAISLSLLLAGGLAATAGPAQAECNAGERACLFDTMQSRAAAEFDGLQRIEHRLRIAMAQARAGELAGAGAAVDAILAELPKLPSDPAGMAGVDWRGRALFGVAAVLGEMGDGARLDQLLALLQGAEQVLSTQKNETVIGTIARELAPRFAAAGASESALALAGRTGHPERLLGAMSIGAALGGHPDQAVKLAAGIPRIDERVRALSEGARQVIAAGDIALARPLLGSALKHAQDLDKDYQRASAFKKLAELAGQSGDLAGAMGAVRVLAALPDALPTNIAAALEPALLSLAEGHGTADVAELDDALEFLLTVSLTAENDNAAQERVRHDLGLLAVAAWRAEAPDLSARAFAAWCCGEGAPALTYARHRADAIGLLLAEAGATGYALQVAPQLDYARVEQIIELLLTTPADGADTAWSPELLAEAREMAANISRAEHRSIVHRALARGFAARGEADAANAEFEAARGAALEVGNTEQRISSLAHLAMAEAAAGFADRAIASAMAIDDGFARADTLIGAGTAAAEAGTDAGTIFSAARSAAGDIEDGFDRALAYAWLGAARAAAGDEAGARTEFDAAREAVNDCACTLWLYLGEGPRGEPARIVISRAAFEIVMDVYLADALAGAGQRDQALEIYRDAIAQSAELPAERRIRDGVYAAIAERVIALDAFDTAEDVIARIEDAEFADRSLAALAARLAETGRASEARRMANRIGGAEWRAVAYRVMGLRAAEAGDLKQALAQAMAPASLEARDRALATLATQAGDRDAPLPGLFVAQYISDAEYLDRVWRMILPEAKLR